MSAYIVVENSCHTDLAKVVKDILYFEICILLQLRRRLRKRLGVVWRWERGRKEWRKKGKEGKRNGKTWGGGRSREEGKIKTIMLKESKGRSMYIG